MPEGRYLVVATAEGHNPDVTTVTLHSQHTARLTFLLTPQPEITGTVRGPHGGALREVAVTVLETSGQAVTHTVTDTDGRYHLPALPNGRYILVATGYTPTRGTARLHAGQPSTVNLTLPPPTDDASQNLPTRPGVDEQPSNSHHDGSQGERIILDDHDHPVPPSEGSHH